MKQNVKQLCQQYLKQLIEDRQYIHANPELGFCEKNTSNFIAERLEKLHIPYKRCKNSYGITARIKGTVPGPVIGFRADMDALNMTEENDVAYCSKVEGVMHACGHDGHTAVLLGLAALMSEHKELIKGEIVFLFQPAEEIPPGGAISMIEEGCTEGIDAIFALHFDGGLSTGVVSVSPGAIMASADALKITVLGKGGHASSPEYTCDALLAASAAVVQLQSIVSRMVSPMQSAVLSICSFQSGTSACNIIQEKAILLGTVRTFDPSVRKKIEQKMHDVLKGVCTMYGTTYELEYNKGYPTVINHDKETAMAVKAIKEELGYEIQPYPPKMGGEDFAFFLERIPGCFLHIGCANVEKGICSSVHTTTFDIDSDALLVGLECLTAIYLESCK